MFVFSPYWATWSRLLLISTERGFREYVELDMTPVNPTLAGAWDRIPNFIIRLHGTLIKSEHMRHHLPAEVMDLIRRRVGYPLTRRLMYEDIVSQLDLNKLYARHRGGGVPLADVRKV